MSNQLIGTPLKQFHTPDIFDTIVIGSDIGGLDIAALLAKTVGQRVLVLERHHTAGGCLRTRFTVQDSNGTWACIWR